MMRRLLFLIAALVLIAGSGAALAAPHLAAAAANSAGPAATGGLSIDFTGGGMFTDKMMQIIALITILSVAPSILIMMTSFVRIVVVLSLLRTALGLSQSPPNACWCRSPCSSPCS
jgi:flagellar biosynthetic protein FliP